MTSSSVWGNWNLEDVQADGARRVDVAVVDTRAKCDLNGLGMACIDPKVRLLSRAGILPGFPKHEACRRYTAMHPAQDLPWVA